MLNPVRRRLGVPWERPRHWFPMESLAAIGTRRSLLCQEEGKWSVQSRWEALESLFLLGTTNIEICARRRLLNLRMSLNPVGQLSWWLSASFFFFFLRIFPLVRSCAELTLAQAVSDVVNGMVSMHSTWSKSLLGLKYSCSYKGRL